MSESEVANRCARHFPLPRARRGGGAERGDPGRLRRQLRRALGLRRRRGRRRGWRPGPTSPAWPRRPAGELLCHEGMSLAAAGDAVGHSGQAVTMPAARGQHLFTRTKRFLMDWATEQGLAGMYSEATAAHPYSQRANIELGAHETGFLLGWIPASVSNDAAGERAARAPVGGALLHQAERRPRAPGLRARAPPRDRRPDAGAVRAARDARRAAGRTPSWPSGPSCTSRSTPTTTWR